MSAIGVMWATTAFRSAPPVDDLLRRVTQAQYALGADANFSSPEPHLGLACNQAIRTPEDRLEAQPLWSSDRSACLVGDFRLDERADLASELQIAQFHELPDSALVLAAWLRWGEACVDHLLGGFAFAVWCPARRELFAARDHTGERPLFYYRTEHLFALASMAKGLLALPGVFQGFDPLRVVSQLAQEPPEWNRSYFEGISRVPPGHLLRVRQQGVECVSYWHPSRAKAVRFAKREDYHEAALNLLDRATASRMRGIGGIGSQLSAGLDSAAVTASAAQTLAARGQGLTAYTYVPQPGFLGLGMFGRLIDEAPGARDVASMYPNVEHVLVDTSGTDLVKNMQALTDAADEPLLNSVNALWSTAFVARARERGIGTMLHGTAGNQTLTYDGDRVMETYFRQGHWLKLFRLARTVREKDHLGYKDSLLIAGNGLLPDFAKRWLRGGHPPLSLNFSAASPEIAERFGLLESHRKFMEDDRPPLADERRRGFEMYDSGCYNAGMESLSGVRLLDPLGDKRMWDFSYGIPPKLFVEGEHSRGFARHALRGRLPEATVWRYQRGQQGVDWYLNVKPALHAIREELELQQASPAAREYVDLQRLIGLVETWPESRHEKGSVGMIWNFALTRGLAMGYFLRTWESRAREMTAEI